MKKLLILLLLCFNTLYSQVSITGLHSSNKSIGVQFTKYNRLDKSTLDYNLNVGVGVSFFYNKGNKGKDYTGFIDNYQGLSYESFDAREGSIYVIVGNKLTNSFEFNMLLGLGVVTKYYNGKGLNTLPNELWYVRRRGYNQMLIGGNLVYSLRSLRFIGNWDSFNSFGLGLGFTIKDH